MSEGMINTLTDPNVIVAFLVAVAVLATFYSLAVPFFERGNLEKRMKSVATERELIRARERVRLNAEVSGGKASLRAQNNTSVRQIVERLNLRKALVDDNTVNRLKSAGYRSQNALNMFLVARFCLPFLFLAVGAFYIFFLGYLADKPFTIRILAVICIGYLGFYAPNIFISNAVSKRQHIDPQGVAGCARPAVDLRGIGRLDGTRHAARGRRNRRTVGSPCRRTGSDHGGTVVSAGSARRAGKSRNPEPDSTM